MKNLKKVLALVLAATMSLTMMASAAFTDAKDINATEAVDTLAALGIIGGYTDGSYQPEKVVTRGEMAKMIFTLRNSGKSDASFYNNLPTTFRDINGHWAAGYIKYAQSLGIIAGKSATTFAPDAPVTGLEAAKMLLVTIGYDATKAGLVGATWSLKTASIAGENGLFDNFVGDLTVGAPRQYAAQLIFNAIDAETVKYEGNEVVKTALTKTITEKQETYDADGKLSGYTYVTRTVTENQTVGEKYMSLKTLTGKLYSTGKYAIAEVSGTKEGLTVGGTNFTDVKNDYSALIGQEVKVMYKDSDEVYGVAPTTKNKVFKTTLNKVEADGAKVKFGGTSYSVDNNLTIYEDDKAGVAATSANFNPKRDDAYDVTFIDNDKDDKFEIAIIKTFKVAKVTYVGTDNLTLDNGVGNKKFADVVSYEGIKKDDYVVVTTDFYADKPVYTLAEKNTGKVTGIKGAEYLIDGTWYKTSRNYTPAKISAGDTLDYIAFGGLFYYVKKTDGNVASKDVAVIVKAEETTAGTSAKQVEAVLAFVNGNEKIVTINKVGTSSTNANDAINYANAKLEDVQALAGKLVTYKVDNDGKYQVTKVEANNDAGYDALTANSDVTSSTKDNKIGAGEVADDATIFVFTEGTQTGAGDGKTVDNDITVITGKEYKRINNASNAKLIASNPGRALITKTSGFSSVKVASVTAATADNDTAGYNTKTEKFTLGITSASTYGYLTSDVYQMSESNKDYNVYTFWNGTDEVTAKEESSTANTFKAGDVIAYDNVSEGLIKNVGTPEVKESAVTAYQDNKVQFDSIATSYKITNDTVVMYVNTDKKTGVAGGSIAIADEPATGMFVKNVKHITTSDVDFILVDVNNQLAKATYNVAVPTAYTTPEVGGISAIANNGTVTTAKAGSNVAVKFTTTGNVAAKNTVTIKVTIKLDNNASDIVVTKVLTEGTVAGNFEVEFVMPYANVTAIAFTMETVVAS